MVVREHRGCAGESTLADGVISARVDRRELVSQAAARAGISREGCFRKFAKRHAMPPYAFWLMVRLRHARGLLRAGEEIAAVAAEVGFIDQSHLDPWLRRAFGITSGCYRWAGRGHKPSRRGRDPAPNQA